MPDEDILDPFGSMEDQLEGGDEDSDEEADEESYDEEEPDSEDGEEGSQDDSEDEEDNQFQSGTDTVLFLLSYMTIWKNLIHYPF